MCQAQDRVVDLTVDESLKVSIADALNEQDVVKFTVQTKVSLCFSLSLPLSLSLSLLISSSILLFITPDNLGALSEEGISGHAATRGVCVAARSLSGARAVCRIYCEQPDLSHSLPHSALK